MFNTVVLFLKKDKEATSKEFDDDEWIDVLPAVPLAADNDPSGSLWWRSVEVSDVVEVGQEMEVDAQAMAGVAAGGDGDIRMSVQEEIRNAGDAPRAESATAAAPKVRPIQMGEFLRKWVSRRLLLLQKGDINKVMAAMRQLGVGMSGGAEALAIFQQLLYELWKSGGLQRPLARVKVDEKNCFGMLEWPAVREASRETLPRHYAVACGKHAAVSQVEQRDVNAATKDRGAEQGDVDGPLECSLTLGGVARTTRQAIHDAQRRGELPWATSEVSAARVADEEFDRRTARAEAWNATAPVQRREQDGSKTIVPDPRHEIQASGGLADFWYLDDGDILCDPRLVYPYLRSFDTANDLVGGVRNRVKTEVAYFADEADLEAYAEEWQLDQVRELASIRTVEACGLTLGVQTGCERDIEAQLRQKVKVVKGMQSRVALCHDVQTEHVLNRQSLGIGRVNHILRVHGDQPLRAGGALSEFGRVTRAEKDRLFPGLGDESHEQASLAAAVGGLGWRGAAETARPANLGALVMGGPRVRAMTAAATHAGLLRAGQIEELLEAKTRQVEANYLSILDELERVKAEDFLQRSREAAEEDWQRVVAGTSDAGGSAPRADVTYTSEHEHSATTIGDAQDGGSGDTEVMGRRLTAPHIQKELARLQDCTRLRALEATLRSQGIWSQVERLKELRHPEVSHKWLWHLDSANGAVMTQRDYVTCVQKRLGARVYEGSAACRLCGAPLDPQLEHSECCATAEATRGHYAVVRSVVEGLRLADPTVTTEPRGLTSTLARPADILTLAAVPGRSAALDVCVASPNAAGAQGDAAEAAFRRKLRRYRNEIPELASAGIAFRPLVWTADGRPHPAVTRTLRFAAELASSRGGHESSAQALMGRWRHEIQVAIQRRRAAMTRAVLPRANARANWLLTGRTDSLPSSGSRAAPVDDDDSEGADEEGDDGWIDHEDDDASLHEGTRPDVMDE
jgi:hypothetical protein